jgi:hypothetical protein
MWTIYLIMALISPLAIILTKDSFVSDNPEETTAKDDSAADVEKDEEENTVTANA